MSVPGFTAIPPFSRYVLLFWAPAAPWWMKQKVSTARQLHAYLVGAAYNLLRLARLQPLTG